MEKGSFNPYKEKGFQRSIQYSPIPMHLFLHSLNAIKDNSNFPLVHLLLKVPNRTKQSCCGDKQATDSGPPASQFKLHFCISWLVCDFGVTMQTNLKKSAIFSILCQEHQKWPCHAMAICVISCFKRIAGDRMKWLSTSLCSTNLYGTNIFRNRKECCTNICCCIFLQSVVLDFWKIPVFTIPLVITNRIHYKR